MKKKRPIARLQKRKRENTRHERFVRRARLNSDHHVIQMALLILDIMQSAHGAACFADKCCLHRASSSSW
jgi:hypothetical protein